MGIEDTAKGFVKRNELILTLRRIVDLQWPSKLFLKT